MSRSIRSALLVAVTLGCGQPAAPDIPDLSDGSMHLFGILMGDSLLQTVLVSQTDGLSLTGVEGTLSEVAPDGSLIPLATATRGRVPVSEWYSQAASVSQAAGPSEALTFETVVTPGSRYQVRVTAPGRPTAFASTTVPGDFTIDTVQAAGDPPGVEGVMARWTASPGSFRYITYIRAEPDCVTQAPACSSIGIPWSGVTEQTRLDTVVPPSVVPEQTQAVEVAVYAVNRELFEYLTTGVGGPFTVQPKQNVSGGYGVVGAWVRRQRSVQRAGPGREETIASP